LCVITYDRDRRGGMVQRLDKVILGLIDVLVLVNKEPLDTGDPGLSFRCLEEIQCFQRQLVDVIEIVEGLVVMNSEDLLRECMKCPAEESLCFGSDEGVESLTHDGRCIVRECKKNYLARTGTAVGQKMRYSGC